MPSLLFRILVICVYYLFPNHAVQRTNAKMNKKTGKIADGAHLVVSLPSMKKALAQFPETHKPGMMEYVHNPPFPPFGVSDLPQTSQEPSFLGYPITQNGFAMMFLSVLTPPPPSTHFHSECRLPAAALASHPECNRTTILSVRLPPPSTSSCSSTFPMFTSPWPSSVTMEI